MSLTPERTAELQELCRQYRIDVLTAIHGAQSGHPGGSLSVCEILTLLYQQRMHVDAAHPDDPDRDRLVLCKGHAAPMLYRNLIGKGFLPPESMNTLRKTIADNRLAAEKSQEEVATKELEVKKVKDQLSGIVEAIEVRKKSFDRNSLSAVIVAVNNDWGFVVIEGGQNKGLTTESKLLVVRGNQPIGRLKIVSVDTNKTLANVEPKSVNPGMSVMPGDRVILETLYQ